MRWIHCANNYLDVDNDGFYCYRDYSNDHNTESGMLMLPHIYYSIVNCRIILIQSEQSICVAINITIDESF